MHDGRYLSAHQLSERLGLSRSAIYKMSAAGVIPSVSVGPRLGGRRFVEQDVRAAIARHVQPPRAYHPPRKVREAVVDQVGEMAQ